MPEPIADAPVEVGAGFGPAGRALLAITKQLAIIGGLVFVGLVLDALEAQIGRAHV